MRRHTEEISFLLPVREFADKGIKWLLESTDNVKGLLEIVAADLVGRLNFSRLELVNQSFIPDNLRQQESDVVCLVPFTGNETDEVLIYLLIEHQSTPSHVMGFRILFYMTQIWDAQRRGWENKKVPESQWRFRPIIPIVLYTGSRKWEMPIEMSVLMELPEVLKRFVPSFDTLFLDVKGSVDKDLFVPDNPFSILLSVIRQEGATKAEFESALRRAVEALNHLSQDSPQWVRAVYYLVLMIYHKRPKEEHDPLREMVFEGIGERSQTKEVDQMSQTMAEYLMEQGEKRGRVHGEKRGEARGQLKAKREDILEILRLRFDTVPDAMERKIKSIRRLDRLDGLLKQAVTAESVSEIVMD